MESRGGSWLVSEDCWKVSCKLWFNDGGQSALQSRGSSEDKEEEGRY